MDDMNLTSEPGMIPEDALPDLLWYGVFHVDRTVSVKRYHSWADYKEAGDSDFTIWTTRIFEAPSSIKAYDKAHGMVHNRFCR